MAQVKALFHQVITISCFSLFFSLLFCWISFSLFLSLLKLEELKNVRRVQPEESLKALDQEKNLLINKVMTFTYVALEILYFTYYARLNLCLDLHGLSCRKVQMCSRLPQHNSGGQFRSLFNLWTLYVPLEHSISVAFRMAASFLFLLITK